MVFHQPASSGSTDLSYDVAWPARADPASGPDPLGRYDAILVGDVDPADLTTEIWARLDAYVAEPGRDADDPARPPVLARRWPAKAPGPSSR